MNKILNKIKAILLDKSDRLAVILFLGQMIIIGVGSLIINHFFCKH